MTLEEREPMMWKDNGLHPQLACTEGRRALRGEVLCESGA